MRIKIDLPRIKDWPSFHDVFAEAMGFPGFYGRNMNAWIDCMSYIDDPEAEMSAVVVKPGEILELELDGVEQFSDRSPDILKDLFLCTGCVNERFNDAGIKTRISLIPT